MQTKIETTLFIAIRDYNSTKSWAISALIEKGASLSETNSDNHTPIELAASLKLWDCVKLIATNWKTDAEDAYGYSSALLDAVAANETDAAIALIHAKASPNMHYFMASGNCCLHWAVTNKNITLLKLLIDKNADLTAENKNNVTPLELAASSGFWDGVELLVASGKTDTKDKAHYGLALLEAVKAGKSDIVKVLIKANALLPWFFGTIVRKIHEETPVEAGTRLGHWDCVQILLEHDKDHKKNKKR
jgi:ankyrin repeat protein